MINRCLDLEGVACKRERWEQKYLSITHYSSTEAKSVVVVGVLAVVVVVVVLVQTEGLVEVEY